jgi:rubrerythrin
MKLKMSFLVTIEEEVRDLTPEAVHRRVQKVWTQLHKFCDKVSPTAATENLLAAERFEVTTEGVVVPMRSDWECPNCGIVSVDPETLATPSCPHCGLG